VKKIAISIISFPKNIIIQINKLIFNFDIKLMFILVEPLLYPSKASYKNLSINIFFYLLNLRIKQFIKSIFTIICLILIDILKIIYFPIIIFFYFSRYKFVQVNYTQIGVLTQSLNVMVKKNLIDGYKSIILIPSHSDFSFIKEIFKNLIIIDNCLLNILLLPLKHTDLISCTCQKVDHFLDSNLQLINSSPFSKIFLQYNLLNKDKDIFEFKNEFKENMHDHFKENYSELDLANTFVIHHREKYFNNTSHLRGSDLSTYLPSIKYLLNKGYGVIRLTHSKSQKLNFKNKLYKEINTDFDFNKKLQFFLLLKCKGFIATDSGPNSIGSLLSIPVYNTNVYGINVNGVNKKSLYILKKVKLNKKILTYRDLIDLNYYRGYYLSKRYSAKIGFKVIDNNKKEILDGLKEFISLKTAYVPNKMQIKFKKSLPDYIELKYYLSNISNAFIKKNIRLFSGLI
jgi:putative glycosyltransferase (TIGR04372 family)